MSAEKKMRPVPFFLPANNPVIRNGEGNALVRYLKSTPKDKNIKIVVSEGKEKRSEEMNALWWCWNQELEREHDDSYTPDDYHAMNKLHVLLPLMCSSWERWREEGEFIRVALMSVPDYDAQLKFANRFIESSTLHIAEGTLYTKHIQQYWLERGIELVVKPSTKRYKNHPEANA